LAIDAIEAFSTTINFSLKNDRYDSYRRVFGNEQVEAMHKLRYFLIGAGALGCEFLKNFAMIGVATELKVKYLTESYSSSTPNTKEDLIPQFTLHFFPSNINHYCISAREQFHNFF
jgi:hypothetical protein